MLKPIKQAQSIFAFAFLSILLLPLTVYAGNPAGTALRNTNTYSIWIAYTKDLVDNTEPVTEKQLRAAKALEIKPNSVSTPLHVAEFAVYAKANQTKDATDEYVRLHHVHAKQYNLSDASELLVTNKSLVASKEFIISAQPAGTTFTSGSASTPAAPVALRNESSHTIWIAYNSQLLNKGETVSKTTLQNAKALEVRPNSASGKFNVAEFTVYMRNPNSTGATDEYRGTYHVQLTPHAHGAAADLVAENNCLAPSKLFTVSRCGRPSAHAQPLAPVVARTTTPAQPQKVAVAAQPATLPQENFAPAIIQQTYEYYPKQQELERLLPTYLTDNYIVNEVTKARNVVQCYEKEESKIPKYLLNNAQEIAEQARNAAHKIFEISSTIEHKEERKSVKHAAQVIEQMSEQLIAQARQIRNNLKANKQQTTLAQQKNKELIEQTATQLRAQAYTCMVKAENVKEQARMLLAQAGCKDNFATLFEVPTVAKIKEKKNKPELATLVDQQATILNLKEKERLDAEKKQALQEKMELEKQQATLQQVSLELEQEKKKLAALKNQQEEQERKDKEVAAQLAQEQKRLTQEAAQLAQTHKQYQEQERGLKEQEKKLTAHHEQLAKETAKIAQQLEQISQEKNTLASTKKEHQEHEAAAKKERLEQEAAAKKELTAIAEQKKQLTQQIAQITLDKELLSQERSALAILQKQHQEGERVHREQEKVLAHNKAHLAQEMEKLTKAQEQLVQKQEAFEQATTKLALEKKELEQERIALAQTKHHAQKHNQLFKDHEAKLAQQEAQILHEITQLTEEKTALEQAKKAHQASELLAKKQTTTLAQQEARLQKEMAKLTQEKENLVQEKAVLARAKKDHQEFELLAKKNEKKLAQQQTLIAKEMSKLAREKEHLKQITAKLELSKQQSHIVAKKTQEATPTKQAKAAAQPEAAKTVVAVVAKPAATVNAETQSAFAPKNLAEPVLSSVNVSKERDLKVVNTKSVVEATAKNETAHQEVQKAAVVAVAKPAAQPETAKTIAAVASKSAAAVNAETQKAVNTNSVVETTNKKETAKVETQKAVAVAAAAQKPDVIKTSRRNRLRHSNAITVRYEAPKPTAVKTAAVAQPATKSVTAKPTVVEAQKVTTTKTAAHGTTKPVVAKKETVKTTVATAPVQTQEAVKTSRRNKSHRTITVRYEAPKKEEVKTAVATVTKHAVTPSAPAKTSEVQKAVNTNSVVEKTKESSKVKAPETSAAPTKKVIYL